MQISTQKLLVAKHKHNIIYYTPAIGWGILIIYFSLLPSANVPSILKNIWDFYLHSAIYFLLAALIFLGHARYKITPFNFSTVIFTTAWVAVMGGILELIQEYVILNRTAEWSDFFANISGAVLAGLIWWIIAKRLF